MNKDKISKEHQAHEVTVVLNSGVKAATSCHIQDSQVVSWAAYHPPA